MFFGREVAWCLVRASPTDLYRVIVTQDAKTAPWRTFRTKFKQAACAHTPYHTLPTE